MRDRNESSGTVRKKRGWKDYNCAGDSRWWSALRKDPQAGYE